MPPRKRKRKDEKRTQKIMIGVVTILIMFGSIVGFIFGGSTGGSSSQKVRHGDFTFTYTGGSVTEPWAAWTVKVDKERFGVYALPEQLENLVYDITISRMLRTPVLYVTIEPPNATQDPLSEAMGLTLFRFQQDYSRRDTYVAHALTHPPTNESLLGLEDWEVRGCTDATETVPVVMLTRVKNTSINGSITLDGNCIIVEAGHPNEFLMFYDRILLGFLGVMP